MSDRPGVYEPYEHFLTLPYAEQRAFLLSKSSEELDHESFQKALHTFKQASERIPAYKDFLAKHKVDPEKIHSEADFASLPTVNKHNYLLQYPLHELCWDGNLDGSHVISVSSGSTGRPFMWPRDLTQEREVDFWYSLTYEDIFQVPEKRTLVLICFALGMYIAGPFTFASSLRYAETGKPMSVVCPSNNLEATIRILQELSPEYDQIVIGGYPPLVKDIIDLGKAEGFDWKKKTTRLFFGGESYSEQWRDYVHKQISAPQRTGYSVNMYGTADAAILGIETPTTVILRSLAESTETRLAFFEDERLPSVVTYNPLFKYFEVGEERSLIFTDSTGLPLIRYEIGDQGGLISYPHLRHLIEDTSGRNLESHLEEEHFSHLNLPLPALYLFGRKNFTVQLYGANVYPENIKEALEDPALNKEITGKFIVTVEHKEDMTPYLQLRIQAREGSNRSAELRDTIAERVTNTLRRRNSEYEVIYNTIREGAVPSVILDAFHNPDYVVGIKHRWVR